ncbi:glycoside hydrolase family 53 protein [Celerinatantimonas yamalensis]|uniref:Arabinogalactan endo-beta-1,4-galactanase n=1 Tax=Celerinatantimonas yamalensis TaxID=559956 RepID=A0ABW9G6F2_9GAMM
MKWNRLLSIVMGTALMFSQTNAYAFVKGADVSWVSQMESAGYRFNNSQGQSQDLFAILKSYGINTIRLRVWVNSGYYNSIEDVLQKAKRAKTAGMAIMIDFHYSDTWADPGHQSTPSAWKNYDLNGLMKAMWWYTHDALTQLKNAGITPAYVQVGNETNNGMMWPLGKASANMRNFAWLINTGYDATKNVFPNAKVIVHLANCQNNSTFRWIFDGIGKYGAKYDIIGASIYPTNVSGESWQLAEEQCYNNLNDMVSRYNKNVIISEIGAPWNAKESQSIVATMINYVYRVKNNRGLGLLYWEPEAANFQKYTMGAWDPNTMRPMNTLNAFK